MGWPGRERGRVAQSRGHPFDLESLAQAAGVTLAELLRAALWTVDQGGRQSDHEPDFVLSQGGGTARVRPVPICWPDQGTGKDRAAAEAAMVR